MAAPIPEDPPVTIATRPSNRLSIVALRFPTLPVSQA
jgi:hypothetical protein